jgi:hypothetical protein
MGVVVVVTVYQLWLLIGLGALIASWVGFRPTWAAWAWWYWVGFAGFVALAQALHLFLPIRSWVPLVLTPLAALGWARQAIWRDRPRLSGIAAVLVVAAVVAFACLLLLGALQPIVAMDDGLYYIQSVLWARDFPTVPGVGNLNPCLAANQSYFLWVAAWSIGPLFAQPSVVANTSLLLMASIPGLVSLMRMLAWDGRAVSPMGVLSAVALVPLLDITLRPQVSSPVADLALAATQMAVMIWLLSASLGNVEAPQAVLVAWMTTVFATVKLPGAWAEIVAWVVALWSLRRSMGALKRALAGTALVVAIWMLNGLILSGYPVFPLPFFALPVPWRVPAGVARAYSVVSFAQHHWFAMNDRSGQIPADWPLLWLQRRWVDNREFLIPAVVLTLGWIGLTVKHLHGQSKRSGWTYTMWASACVALWFAAAPELRMAEVILWCSGFGVMTFLVAADQRAHVVAWALGILLLLGGSFIGPLPPWSTISFHLPGPARDSETQVTLSSGDTVLVGSETSGCQHYPCMIKFHPHVRFRQPGDLAAGFERDQADSEFP